MITSLNDYDVFISGEKVDLVVLDQKCVDVSNWYKWFNDEETTFDMQKHYFPNTKAMQLEYFKEHIESDNSKLQLGILEKKDNVLIGIIALGSIDYHNRKCEIGGLIGEKAYRSLAYWLEANKLIINHAFKQLNMLRIYGGTMSYEVMQMYVKALKFSHEGTLISDVFKNGKHNDVYLVGLLNI